MNISIILSTYNKPHFLERVLWGYAVQTQRDFELLVADDGSRPDTLAMIRRFESDAGLRVRHVWHEDRGFRKTGILNRAIVESAGDYLVFSDGDCIPRRDLVATHAALARPDHYLAGGYVKLPAGVSDAITIDDVRAGRFADLGWLRAQGWKPGRRALRLTGSARVGAVLDRLTPTAAHFHGNNASVSRRALLEVNGFEGTMGYGGLDRALGYRLENLGVRGIQARHRAVCMHLHHDHPYRDAEVVRRNRDILERLKRSGEYRAIAGIAELAPDPGLRVDGAAPGARLVRGGTGL